MKSTHTLTAVFATILGLSTYSSAAVIVSDDFEDGVFTTATWVGETAGFTEAGGTLNTVTNSAARLIGNATTFDFNTDPIINIVMDFRVNTGGTSPDYIGVGLFNDAASGGYITRFNTFNTPAGASANVSESTAFDTIISHIQTGNAGGLAVGSNYRITFNYNFDTGAISSTLRNLTTSTDVITMSGTDTSPVATLNRFGIYTFGAETNDFSILSYNASAIPEPSSTALLGLSGIALILRRKRR